VPAREKIALLDAAGHLLNCLRPAERRYIPVQNLVRALRLSRRRGFVVLTVFPETKGYTLEEMQQKLAAH
jgi:acetolactate synthase regulatory subunit